MDSTTEYRDILRGAARILAERGWCQGSPAVDERGVPVAAPSSDAVRFCATGAIHRAVWELNAEILVAGAAVKALAIHVNSIPAHWNDQPGRSAEDVILALKRAADD